MSFADDGRRAGVGSADDFLFNRQLKLLSATGAFGPRLILSAPVIPVGVEPVIISTIESGDSSALTEHGGSWDSARDEQVIQTCNRNFRR